MSHRRAAAALFLFVLVVVAFWLVKRTRGHEDAPGAITRVAAAPASAVAHAHDEINLIAALVPKKAPTRRSTGPRAFPVRSPRDEADQVVAEVRPAAEAGDPTAMRTLGEVLNECTHADMRSDDEIEATAAKQSLDLEYLKKQGVTSVVDGETDPTKMAVRIAETKKHLRDSCRKIPPEELKAANDWIDRAANDGDEIAGTDRAGRLVQQINDQSLPLDQREEARSQMIELLQDQIGQGHCNNMVLNLFWQQSHDPMLVYIYGGILMRRGIATINSLPPDRRQTELASLERQDRTFAAALAPDQLAAAEATRAYIESNFCDSSQ